MRQVLRNLHRGMEPERHHTWSISLGNRASAIWWLRGRQAGGCLACTCVPGSQEPNTAKLHRLPCSPRRLPYTGLGTGCQTFARDTLARLAGRKMATFYFQRLSSFGGSGGIVQRFLSLSCVFGLEKCVSLIILCLLCRDIFLTCSLFRERQCLLYNPLVSGHLNRTVDCHAPPQTY